METKRRIGVTLKNLAEEHKIASSGPSIAGNQESVLHRTRRRNLKWYRHGSRHNRMAKNCCKEQRKVGLGRCGCMAPEITCKSLGDEWEEKARNAKSKMAGQCEQLERTFH